VAGEQKLKRLSEAGLAAAVGAPRLLSERERRGSGFGPARKPWIFELGDLHVPVGQNACRVKLVGGGCDRAAWDPREGEALDMYGHVPYRWIWELAGQEVNMPRTDTDTAGKRARAERLEARVSSEQKNLFLRAAALQGRSLTDFLVASAQEVAIETIRTHEAMRLGERDRQVFVSALLAVSAPAKTLGQAAKRYRERTGL
jgi:uncharacterized protein (DUF1778 family)